MYVCVCIYISLYIYIYILYMKTSDPKASKCHLKLSSRVIIFIKLCLCSVISL